MSDECASAPRKEIKHHQCKLQQVMTIMSASGAFALVDRKKNTTSTSLQCQDHLGHKYRNGMQQLQPNADRSRDHLNADLALVLPAVWLLHPASVFVARGIVACS